MIFLFDDNFALESEVLDHYTDQVLAYLLLSILPEEHRRADIVDLVLKQARKKPKTLRIMLPTNLDFR